MSDDDVQLTEDQRVAALEEKFPNSPYSERLRFLRACKGSVTGATVKLQAYYDWRELHGLDLPEYADTRLGQSSDEQDWLLSCKKAVEHIEKLGKESLKKKSSPSDSTKSLSSFALPQIVFAYTDEKGLPMTSKSGRRLLHVMPARINKKLASAETYALALSLYLDHKQDRNKLDLFFVMLDVRPGKGWANPPAYNMMPFIKAVGNLLHQHYPERLDKLFLYPLPRPALWIWEMVKPFLDPSVVESAHLIAGKDTVAAPPPNHALCSHVDEDLLEVMENTRICNFIDKVQV
ncbi:CRAL/TRIO domain containing protein [Fragilaria crotonensis]|nr:CRAL/TRIO domain containing protein [Fragilaria crotonensis]